MALHHLENGGESDSFNLSNAKGTSVLEVVDSVKRVTDKDFNVVIAPRRPGDQERLVGSQKKAMEILGWQPKYVDIDTIVKHAWNWHENKEY